MLDDRNDPASSNAGPPKDCGRWWCAYETHLRLDGCVELASHHLTLGRTREATDDADVTVELVGVGNEPPTLLLTRTPDEPDSPFEADPPTPRWVARMDPLEAARLVLLVLRGVNKVLMTPDDEASPDLGDGTRWRAEARDVEGADQPIAPALSGLLASFPREASADLLLGSLRQAGVVLHANDLAVVEELAEQPLALGAVLGWVRDARR